MQARGRLMMEHRIIERMIEILREATERFAERRKADSDLIDAAVDFIRTYADQTHHGKEEKIMFEDLENRELSEEDRDMMEELIDEHVFAGNRTQSLIAANDRYRDGDESAIQTIIDEIRTLVEFYPNHIEKEDKVFFPASRNYYTDDEDRKMLERFLEFDREMIHIKYKAVVEKLERLAD